ncbi:MAG TPA: peptidoglycan DD-metalloendopeptidase family protein [Xanthobacteraceae bacterium]|nr:peptidoglycan DD-metalloendopeptidase family protein [Xanthobacteraceae bacterium]
MSQPIASQHEHRARALNKRHESALRPEPRQRTVSHAATQAGYTIAHAGRQVRFGPVAFWIAVGTFVIMACWSITTATYFAFHDDVLKGLMAREQAQQYAYEDRIADLREQIDRTTSRQLLDQSQFEHKLDELVHRQTTLESRASALSGVTDPATTGSVRPAARAGTQAAQKPAPFNDMLFAPHPLDAGKQSSIETKLNDVEASLDRVDHDETSALDQMQARYEVRTRQVRGILDQLGLKFNAAPTAEGGPFVPVRLPPASESFARALTRVSIARAQATDLGNTLNYVPLRKPLAGDLEMTSPFGVRIDPFVHQPSMHTGMDFRGNVGDPIYATAAGRVTKAGWDGGYGQMVEIDHGEGLATRYGHMSQIDVTVGERVRAGQMIGRIGTTGRSTGPHLHYETRVNGEPVNPEKFLIAGQKLFGLRAIVRLDRNDVQD